MMPLADQIRAIIGSGSAKHRRLVDYAVRQLHAGRDLDAVLGDPYITNRATPVERRALLEVPEVTGAAHEELLMRMRARLEALAGG